VTVTPSSPIFQEDDNNEVVGMGLIVAVVALVLALLVPLSVGFEAAAAPVAPAAAAPTPVAVNVYPSSSVGLGAGDLLADGSTALTADGLQDRVWSRRATALPTCSTRIDQGTTNTTTLKLCDLPTTR
jgi:hypothetical protein